MTLVGRPVAQPLGRSAWQVLGGEAVSSAGMGLTLPFLLVYLHEQRGVPVPVAALITASIGLAGFVGNPIGGWLSDVIGAQRVAVAGLLVVAVGAAATPGVHSAWQGFAAAATYGLGIALAAPARGALVALVVPPEQRARAFALRYGLNSLGQAVGGLAGAALVAASASGFTVIYLVEAATFVGFAVLTASARPVAPAPASPRRAVGGYRRVFADRRHRAVLVVVALVVTAGYGQQGAGFTGYATASGIDAGGLGLAFGVSAVVVVLAQLPVTTLTAGLRRGRVVAAAALTTAAGWAVALVGSSLWTFVAGMALFGLAATAFTPVVAALVTDLAPDDLRGRYNASLNLTYTTGFTAGPVIAGAFLSAGHPAAPLMFAVCALLLAAALSLRLPDVTP